MRKVFVALALIAIITNAALLPEVKQSITQSLSKLHNSRMGKNIITAIQLEMASNNKENIVSRILVLLHELLDEQVTQEATAESDLSKRTEDCESTRQNYQGQVDTKRADVAGAEARVPVLESQITFDLESHKNEQNIFDDSTQALNEENESNADAVAAFEKSQRNHNAMEEALKQARELISQLQSSSFLQKNDVVLAQIQSHNTISMKSLEGHSNKALFALLMQMAQDVGIQADQELVGNVINVIDDLLRYEQESVEAEVVAEGSRFAEHNNRVDHLTQQINNAASEVARLDAEITKNSNELAEAQNHIVQWNEQLAELIDLLAEHNGQCDADINNFHVQIDELNQQIEVIREVIAIFEGQAINDIRSVVENLEF